MIIFYVRCQPKQKPEIVIMLKVSNLIVKNEINKIIRS